MTMATEGGSSILWWHRNAWFVIDRSIDLQSTACLLLHPINARGHVARMPPAKLSLQASFDELCLY